MSKVNSTIGLPVEYNRQAMDRIFREIDKQINRVADGYLFAVTSVSTSYTATKNDSLILADSTSGNITITLPSADQMKEKRLTIKKINSANTVTIEPAGAETIDNAANLAISTQYDSYDIVSDGTEWWII